jgi:hypothetical protein
MAAQIPFQRIWRLGKGQGVAFNESHVLPECVGNAGQHGV